MTAYKKNNESKENEYTFGEYSGILIDDNEILNDELEILLEFVDINHFMVLGLDCEWVSGYKFDTGKIGMLQLAYMDRVLLIRLDKNELYQNELLKKVLNHNDILKFGVKIYNDKIRLYSDYKIILNNVVDLVLVFWKIFNRVIDGNKLNKLDNICYKSFKEKKLSSKNKYISIEYRHKDISLNEIYQYLLLNNDYNKKLSWIKGDHKRWSNEDLEYDLIEYAAFDVIRTLKCTQAVIRFINAFSNINLNYIPKYLDIMYKDVIYSLINIPLLRNIEMNGYDTVYIINEYNQLKSLKEGELLSINNNNGWENVKVISHRTKLKQTCVVNTKTKKMRYISHQGFIILMLSNK